MEIGASVPGNRFLYEKWVAAGFNTYTVVLMKTAVTDETGKVVKDEEGEVLYTLGHTEESLKEVFEYFGQREMTVNIRLHSGLLSETGNVFEEYFPNMYKNFDDYPAFSGFFIADEPSLSQLDTIQEVYVPWFNKYYGRENGSGRLEFFVNMLSGVSSAIGSCVDENGNPVQNSFMTYNGERVYYTVGSGKEAVEYPVDYTSHIGETVYYRLDGGFFPGDWAYLTDENGEYIPSYNGAKLQISGIKIDEDAAKTFLAYYHNKWLGILDSIELEKEKKCFSHDCYPFFDNQPGAFILTDVVDSEGNVLMTAEELREMYMYPNGRTDSNGNPIAPMYSEEQLLIGTPDGYEYHLLDEWLARSLNIAVQARDKGYAYGACIQVFDQGGPSAPTKTYRLPTTLAEVQWQVYINLAMGAKKLDYFAFGQNGGGEYMTIGTNATPVYELVRLANAELAQVQHVFAAFKTWVGLKTFTPKDATPSKAFQMVEERGVGLDALTGVSSVTTDRELIVGEMIDGEGRHGYMLVGFDDPLNGNPTDVEMTFDGADGFVVYRGGARDDVVAEDGVFSATLAAGEGVFIIPVYMD